ncbi:unnamed protein product [Ceutorhynchus assimilis]|uniref:Uncharacterized protein n=1 Tax=Ceutorhynchus assimilis TaxID=467358 RepID=A0A9P0GRS4_9CUCU|nr:unnamed protein product [Ceutorhynchus assimilis]
MLLTGSRSLRKLPGIIREYKFSSNQKFEIWLVSIILMLHILAIDQTIIKPNETIDNKIIYDEGNSSAYFNFNKQTKNESDLRTGTANKLLTNKVKESYSEHEDALKGNKEDNQRSIGKKQRGFKIEPRDISDAVEYGLRALEELVQIKEPLLYKLGLSLNENDPAARVANFGAPTNPKAILLSQFGFATLEASKRIAEIYNKDVYRHSSESTFNVQPKADLDECPLRGQPKCPFSSRRFRTADGTCNNLEYPWRGSAMLPMQRFLPPMYHDGIQSIRRSVSGAPLPSPRKISSAFHRDKNHEVHSVTLMFAQWGQFIDHDVTSTVRARGFNGSIPRCCEDGGRRAVPPQFLHPSCLPIEVPITDPFLSRFGIGCMEFLRSAPSTRIDCELGWREQINQVTSYLDGSMIYGSDVDTSDSIRSFRNGQIFYGRPSNQGALEPPDPPGGEICTEGAMSDECIQSGDGRFSETPGLVAVHTVFVRYHNKIANLLTQINRHWSDERVFQETRRIVYAAIQHITYKEYLPVVLGPEVMDLFELRLLKAGYYDEYDSEIFPAIANSFSTAAFRFGHSMIQNSFIRTDSHHIPLPNNISLHNEPSNFENIWSIGSLDRLLLGMSNQLSQKRDEFIADELTNHLFQFSGHFGMDLAAINIQRGRDHGIPPYTFWRKPCGLAPLNNWQDLEQVMSVASVMRLRSLYTHIDDIDLFTAGLAEKPLRGAVVGPTFACIIAQQFSYLRKGDRFWYENEGFESSLSPAQLQQIRKISLAQILCQTTSEIETIQPFVFLSADGFRNVRVSCDSPEIRNFDLRVWAENSFEFNSIASDDIDSFESERSQRLKRDTTKQKPKKTNTTAQLKQSDYATTITKKPSVTHSTKRTKTKSNYYQIIDRNHEDVTYLVGIVPDRTTKAPNLLVNININYSPQSTTSTAPIINRKKQTITTERPYSGDQVTFRPTLASYYKPTDDDVVVITKRPVTSTTRRPITSTTRRPITSTTRRPTLINKKQTTVSYPVFVYHAPTTKRPTYFFDNMEYASTNGLKRPNSNGLGYSDNFDRPTSEYFFSQNSRPSQNSNRPSQSTYGPTPLTVTLSRPINDLHSNRPSQNFYRPTQLSQTSSSSEYFNEHLESSNRPSQNFYRPTNDFETNRPSQNQYRPTVFEDRPFSSSYSTFKHKPTFDNYYDDSESVVITGTNIDRDDTTNNDDILNEFFHRNKEDGGTHRKASSDLALASSTPKPSVDDKLDFTSDFVEISSVKKQEFFAREGIDEAKQKPLKKKSRDNWKVFRAIEGPMLDIEVPELISSVTCSNEVPKPMTEFLMAAEGFQTNTKSR